MTARVPVLVRTAPVLLASAVLVAYSYRLVMKTYAYRSATWARAVARPAFALGDEILKDELYVEDTTLIDGPKAHVGGATLLLVVSQECAQCPEAVKSWADALHEVGNGFAIRIVIAWPDVAPPDGFAQSVRQQFADHNVIARRILSPERFLYVTGLGAAPASVLMSEARQIAYAGLGPPSPAAIRRAIATILDPNDSSGPSLYSERHGPVTPIVSRAR